MKIQEFYDPKTFTLTFVAYDEATHDAVVIDPVPDATRVFVGHDIPAGRAPAALRGHHRLIEAGQRATAGRHPEGRRRGLPARARRHPRRPAVLLPSVQVNVNAGLLPKPAANGVRYLHPPINLFHPTDEVGNPKPA